MADPNTPGPELAPAVPLSSSRRRQWVIGMLALAVVAVVAHYLPVAEDAKTAVGAIALVVVCGMGAAIWLPVLSWDLLVAVVVTSGLSVNVIVATFLLAVRAYSPDTAALIAGALGCVSGLLRLLTKDAR